MEVANERVRVQYVLKTATATMLRCRDSGGECPALLNIRVLCGKSG